VHPRRSRNQRVFTLGDPWVRRECVTRRGGRTLLVPGSRLDLTSLSSGGSRRSISHMSCILVNSLGTPSRTLAAGGFSHRSPDRLAPCRRKCCLIGIGPHDRSVLCSVDRRFGSLGSAWDPLVASRSRCVREEKKIWPETIVNIDALDYRILSW